MARSTTETLVTQSVLDRVTAVEDWPTTRSQSLRFFKDSLKRDLEWLLKARLLGCWRIACPMPTGFRPATRPNWLLLIWRHWPGKKIGIAHV